MYRSISTFLIDGLIFALVLLAATACGGGGGSTPASTPSPTPTPTSSGNWDQLIWDRDNWS